MRGRVDAQVIERFGWTPDQLIIKRAGEVGAETPGWLTAAYNPSQPRDQRGRWTKGLGFHGVSKLGFEGFVAGTGDKERVKKALYTAVGPLKRLRLKTVEYLDQTTLQGKVREDMPVLGDYAKASQKIRIGPEAFSVDSTRSHLLSTDLVDRGMPANWHAPSDGVSGLLATVTHEVGHAAGDALTDEQVGTLFDRLAQAIEVPVPSFGYGNLDLPKSTQAMMWAMDYRQALKEELSGYAGTMGSNEAIAEGWVEWRLSPRPRPAAQAIGQSLEEFLS